jgi:hypothetical protein
VSNRTGQNLWWEEVRYGGMRVCCVGMMGRGEDGEGGQGGTGRRRLSRVRLRDEVTDAYAAAAVHVQLRWIEFPDAGAAGVRREL